MKGCPHNKCTFCNLFKDIKCKALPLEEIFRGMDDDAKDLGQENIGLVDSIYLEGGDPLALRTVRLLAIMRHAKSLFPALTRFACYATARYTLGKTQEDLNALAEAGLKRVFVGLESGYDAILKSTEKGCTVADLLEVGRMLARARIEMDVSMMLGIGGKEYSHEHAIATARLISAIEPECVRIRTFIPKTGTELGGEYLNGNFTLMGPHDIMRELRLMVSEITGATHLLSEHWSDFVMFSAYMPGAKEQLLDHIDKHLAMPESEFRQVGIYEDKS
jgi:radical SAM superfamily enzyme YgiQ (UPF0313 family)